MPLDNPLGLVEAILASATPAELDGRVFGQEALRQDAAWQVALEEATDDSGRRLIRVEHREQQIGGSGGSLEPPGPLS